MHEVRNIVFLGASYAGLSSAHYFLKHVLRQLPTSDKVSYHAVIIDPSSKMYQRPASPLASVNDILAPSTSVFLDIQPALVQYGDAVTFIQGKAISWDPESRQIRISKQDGTEAQLLYHALVVATGSKSYSPLLSLQGSDFTEVQAAHRKFMQEIRTAKRIIILGGGPSGVELAGEVGEALNGTAGWWSSRPANPKAEVTLYTNSSKLLPVLRSSVAHRAETYLNRVGVDVHYNKKVTSWKTLENGQTRVVFHDGQEAIADVFVPAMGAEPMTNYAPKHLLDDKGHIKANGMTLRVEEAGARVYAIGDVASYSEKSIPDILAAVPVVATNLKRDLVAAHTDGHARPTEADRVFKRGPAETQLVPIGRSRGVGALFGWQVPSWVVWLIKGRNYMIGKGVDFLLGKNWAKES